MVEVEQKCSQEDAGSPLVFMGSDLQLADVIVRRQRNFLDVLIVQPGGEELRAGQVFLTSYVAGLDVIVPYLPHHRKMKVIFVGTASNPYPAERKNTRQEDLDWLERQSEQFEVLVYDIAGKTGEQIANDWKDADVVFLKGGNTPYLAEQLAVTCAGEVLQHLHMDGKIIIGESAGAAVLGTDIKAVWGLEPSLASGEFVNTQGLGLIPFVVLPHWGQESLLAKGYEHARSSLVTADRSYVAIPNEAAVRITLRPL